MGINVIKTSREFNAVEKYLLTMDNNVKSVKDVADGTSIAVDGWLVFEDVKADNERVEILSIITPEKEVYACQSATFKRSLMDMENLFGDMKFAVIKTSGKTKSGRPFVNCSLDVNSVK